MKPYLRGKEVTEPWDTLLLFDAVISQHPIPLVSYSSSAPAQDKSVP